MNTGHDWFGWMCRKCGTTADRPEANAACKGGVISASVPLSPEGQEQKQLDQSFAELMSAKPDVEDVSPTQAPLIERRLELSEELRNGLAGVIAKQDEELKLLRAKVSALSPHPPTSGLWLSDAHIQQVMNALEEWEGKDANADEADRKAAFEMIQEQSAGSPHPPSEERK